MSDNYAFDISAEGRTTFDLAMKIAFGCHSKAVAYEVVDGTMILYWAFPHYSKTVQKFPYEMKLEDASNFVWGWVQEAKHIGREPDHDGDNSEGFRVFNQAWGHVNNSWEAFVGIQQVWMMYGK